MRVSLLAVELFAWGKYGGFGRATRTLGRELALRGIEVTAVVPRRAGQRPEEELDGIRVYGFDPRRPSEATEMLRRADADIYHSCEPSLATWLARRALPERRHLVTVRDPRDLRDWWLELRRPSLSRLQVLGNLAYESGPLTRAAVRGADAVYATARSLVRKVERIYRLPEPPGFLPTPVDVPEPAPKAARPTVCSVARLDRRKRPELFCELAARFPDVRFLVAGRSRDPGYERRLRARYAALPNLEFLGFIDQFTDPRHGRLLDESWVLVNTSTREGLPNAFLEAGAHGCAILTSVPVEGFGSSHGRAASDLDGLEAGLRQLLDGDAWRREGERAREAVRTTFATPVALERHLEAYRNALSGGAP